MSTPILPITSPNLLKTTFLIPSIHCPTCASFIENLIHSLYPSASVETSIVSHSVTIHHNRDASIPKMMKILAHSGYEVHTVVADPNAKLPQQERPATSSDDDFIFGWFGNFFQKLNPVAHFKSGRAEKRHLDNCSECRSKHHSSPEPEPGKASDLNIGEPLVVVESSSSGIPQQFQATVTVDGMTCSSCVGRITEVLNSQQWIETADVSLLTRTALVRFYGKENAEQIVDLIESAGYEGKIENTEPFNKATKPGGPIGSPIWRAEFSIAGMSCSSCVGKITHAVDTQPWVKSVDVNLLTNSATIVFEDRSHLNEVISIIEGTGYEAKLTNFVSVGAAEDHDPQRTVSIRVDNMYCEHCPSRIDAALKSIEQPINIEQLPTLANPIMTIRYTPLAPKFTIRNIISSISAVDSAFQPSIYHPPSIEERSREMHARSRRRILYRLLLSVAAAIPGLIIGIIYMTLVSEHNPTRMYLMERLSGVSRAEWSLLITSTPVYFFAADIFHRRTIREIHAMWKPGSPVPFLRRFYRFGSMDMLVSFATSIAYFASIAELIIAATRKHDMDMPEKMPYFDSVIFLTMFLLAGRLIEAYSKAKTGEAVSKLADLRPKTALLIVSSEEDSGNRTEQVSVDMLESGDTVVVIHGASPPWDGILLDKEAEFAEASLTGESRPVKKSTGDEIYSGTVNKAGPVTMKINGAAGESLLDNIIRVVREGQSKRAPIERFADILTGYFVPFVTLFSITTWLIWLGLGVSGRLPEDYLDVQVGGWPFWSLQFAIAIFVIACPCGIGLAAPTALFVGGGLAAQHGILAKGGGEAFQEASSIDIVVFDKTGTLTEGGDLKVTDHLFIPEPNNEQWDQKTILTHLAEIERNSSHPLGKAIVAFCEEKAPRGTAPEEVQEIPGKGMRASFNSTLSMEFLVGNEALMEDYGVLVDENAVSTLDGWKEQAKSVVLVGARSSKGNGTWALTCLFAFSDPIRGESRSVIETLHSIGIDVWMISGDNPKTAHAVGAMVSIPPERIIAGVLPEQKAEKVKYLQSSQTKRQNKGLLSSRKASQRAIVAMVGDGVNDSPALTAADVGIAIGAGSDVAISAAEFVLIKSDLNALLTLVTLSRAVFRRVKFNFAWASIYNLIALPIAAGVLYPVKTNGSYTRLDPVWASLAMALSSVSVICSSLLLRTKLPLVGFRTRTPKKVVKG
ncbi:hypothetical protein TWF718_001994 [Orbilia javanica]|uniref:HMA domain-containing protein n=1 Tax=Orbilia javanica TaxID=47235 RepID=A0AAN8N604_9PEZI